MQFLFHEEPSKHTHKQHVYTKTYTSTQTPSTQIYVSNLQVRHHNLLKALVVGGDVRHLKFLSSRVLVHF